MSLSIHLPLFLRLRTLSYAVMVAPVVLALCSTAVGQAGSPPPPTYTVASIRENRPDGQWRLADTKDGLDAHGVTLRYLLEVAFGIYDDNRIIGGPEWLGKTQFDVKAKQLEPSFTELSAQDRKRMLRTLLNERFGLAVHIEQRSTPVYILVLCKGGARLPSASDGFNSESAGKQPCMVNGISRPGKLSVASCTTTEFANLLPGAVGRPVLDKTSIAGTYNFSLHWNPDLSSASDEPSIWKAVTEQLGLRLASADVPMPVIVVDQAKLPSAN